MALNPTGVSTAIAALSVAGVTLKDLDGVPQQALARDACIVYPDPEHLIDLRSVSRETLGGDSSATKYVSYVLNYVYLHGETGTGRGLADNTKDEVAKLYSFISAVIANADALATAVSGSFVADVVPTHGPLTTLPDPAGHSFRGCKVALTITEWLNY